MNSVRRSGPPRWVFSIITVGAFLACGIYLGMMRIEGTTTGNVIRAASFALLGSLMLWGVLSRPQSN
jgi:hypothetical protein